nr:MAG TPA: hypothetical protein [Caudoviricetes sp.]
MDGKITAADARRIAEARHMQVADFDEAFLASFDTEEARDIAGGMMRHQYHRELSRVGLQ